ncbi:putative GABA permease [Aspergillus nidulans FGSC A4]|uniref:GABA transporter, putative (Eurofung) n=1 Tax=Emericella nidulans (strain FGSC A4 / ATCC 38163 / CBS 112.46 / NRRL 194 / M139) TaxID=227321 RepID=C8VHZ7_EMENI|nr:hypothetical protein [Aspergillus nidulans FGSC A4]CBF82995.1 TPA: GABA transporter, putative (Eurofung) [Aspergillus nidulans FGSC A4]
MEVHTKPPRLGTMDVEVHSPAGSHEGGRQAGTVLDDTDMHRMGKVQELKGTDIRRTVPLGLRVRIAAIPEIPQLPYRYLASAIFFPNYAVPVPTDHAAQPGWMSVLAWQAGSASGSFLTGTIIQGLITIRNPDYSPESWHGTLFVFAMIFVIYVFNVYASDAMPVLNNLLMIFHVLSWCVILIVLWAMAPHRTAKSVFTEWSTQGGWNSIGLSVMIGQISAIYGSLSSDATAHMSEEVSNAGRNVPLAIAWGYFTNGIMAIVLLIAYLFSIPSVEDALSDETGFPFLYVFRNAVSTAGVNGLTSIILIPVIFSNIFFNASTSRQTFAFARDRGLPFADWIAHVDKRRKIPVNAIFLSCLISCLLSLINIGSETAFNAIISLNVAALMYSYIISISCVIYRKLKCPETLPARRWDMGSWGLPVNIIGLVYSCFALFWSLWPGQKHVTAETFNWSVVIFGGVFVISLVLGTDATASIQWSFTNNRQSEPFQPAGNGKTQPITSGYGGVFRKSPMNCAPD